MNNIFNQDFSEFIALLEKYQAEYILVGGYSVIIHGYPRTTGDMDLWVKPTETNYILLKKVFLDFGMPIMPRDSFLNLENDVFTYGRPPQAIDIMTQCKGLEFDLAYLHSKWVKVDELNIRLISIEDLIKAKKSANRFKDLNDLEHLEN